MRLYNENLNHLCIYKIECEIFDTEQVQKINYENIEITQLSHNCQLHMYSIPMGGNKPKSKKKKMNRKSD